MKYLEGILHMIIGVLFIIAPPVSNIDLERLTQFIVGRSEIGDNDFVRSGRVSSEFVTLYEYSTTIVIIGVLFVILGAFKIWREKQNEKIN